MLTESMSMKRVNWDPPLDLDMNLNQKRNGQKKREKDPKRKRSLRRIQLCQIMKK